MILCIAFLNHHKAEPALRDDLQKFAEACLRFTPKIAVRWTHPAPAIFLDISPNQNFLFESLQLKIAALANRVLGSQMSVRVTVADTPMEALALTRWGQPLPVEALMDYANPFGTSAESPEQVDEFTKKWATVLKNFHDLGVHLIDDFKRIPSLFLASRFGEELVNVNQRLKPAEFPQAQPVWPTFKMAEEIFEKEDFTFEPIASLDSLLFALKRMSSRLTARLRGRCLKVSVMELRVQIRRIPFRFPIPQSSTHGIMPILRDQLYPHFEKRPISSPILSVELKVIETALGHGAQKNFFSNQEEEQEAWESLLLRLVQKFPRGQVFQSQAVDRHLPEKSWKRVAPQNTLTKTKAALPFFGRPKPQRPLRLLNEPEPLQRLDDYLISQTTQKRWKVLNWLGPERITGEWWWRQFKRDYFQVETAQGQRLWVFSSSPFDYFLHGYFD